MASQRDGNSRNFSYPPSDTEIRFPKINFSQGGPPPNPSLQSANTYGAPYYPGSNPPQLPPPLHPPAQNPPVSRPSYSHSAPYAQPLQSVANGTNPYAQPFSSSGNGTNPYAQPFSSSGNAGGPYSQPLQPIGNGGGPYSQPLQSTGSGGPYPQRLQSTASGGGCPVTYGQAFSVPPPQKIHQIPVHSVPKQNKLPQLKPQQQSVWTPPAPTVYQSRVNKKALVVGCNYERTEYELKGCIHDAKMVEYMLIQRFGFQKENIRVLTDDGKGFAMPTRSNIFSSFRWLIQNLQPGDSLFFHFSGHGSQSPDHTGDERDGLNETLLPCDHRTAGQIIDDEINERLVNRLPLDVYLHAVIDACHSGTAMDLEFYTKIKNGRIEWRSEGPTRKYKGTSGGTAVLFSACADEEVAQDTNDLSGSVNTGAATHSFIEAVEQSGAHISYAQVLFHMQKKMDDLSKKPNMPSGPVGKILDRFAATMISVLGLVHQTPQISCNRQLNLDERLHI